MISFLENDTALSLRNWLKKEVRIPVEAVEKTHAIIEAEPDLGAGDGSKESAEVV